VEGKKKDKINKKKESKVGNVLNKKVKNFQTSSTSHCKELKNSSVIFSGIKITKIEMCLVEEIDINI
jgi:hypothetical protein